VGFADLMVSDEVVSYYNLAIATLRQMGHTLSPVDLKHWDLPRLRRAVLTLCELDMWRSQRARLNDSPDDFSPGLRAFIRYGGKLADDDIAAAETRIARFYQDWQEAIVGLDAVILPTVACTSFPLGERRPQNTADLTAIASATGLPALQLPIPAPPGALPAGLQLLGHAGHDANLMTLAADLESHWPRTPR
jgi:Asp-tRNA(Asn)/Glu-tRNA(Gln) amidotransferase A subunit family amidase